MRLKEFVAQTLEEIAEGVAAAKGKTTINGSTWIAPARMQGIEVAAEAAVQFDVTVAIVVEGEGGISVVGLGSAKGTRSSENTHRISFAVPVYFQALKGQE